MQVNRCCLEQWREELSELALDAREAMKGARDAEASAFFGVLHIELDKLRLYVLQQLDKI